MKKYLILLCLLFIAVSSQAENKFTVDNIEIKPGEELTVSVGLTNEEDAKSASIDIFLPECLTFVGENGTVVFSSRADGISMKSAKIQTNGALRVGFAIGSIPAGSGELFTFKLKAKDDAASGSYKIQYKTMALTYTSKVNLPDMESAVVVYRNFTISANSSNDEMGTVDGAGEYKENASATLTATPIEGYHFVKWSDETTVNPYTFTVTGEVSLTATFAPNQYTITFDNKGGTPVADVTADYKAAITAPAAPTREGYTFVGWNPAFPETMPLNGATLTATWTPITYTLTYDLAGGSVATANPASYTIESNAITLTNPTREGYTFAGWTGTGLDGATMTVTIAKGSMGNRSYVATWTPITYTLTYDLAGGTLATANPSEYTIENAAITLANPTREGYTFAGWTGTGLDAATTTVTIANGSTGNRSYVATWTPITYTLTYDLAGGSVATANPASYTIESNAITLTNPTREGYTFAGWTGTGLDAATTTVTIAKGSTGNRSYIATWTPITYTLTYDLAGGTLATANPSEYTIESAAITLANPTREGYTFAGWTGTGLSGATQTVTIANGSTGNRSYVATWTPITYTLTYDLAGGSVSTANPANYTIESENITLTNPTREGYTFAGWTGTGLDGVTMTVTIAKGSMGNRSYVATWTPITYTLTYDLAGGAVATANPTEYNIESAAITLTNPTREGYNFAGWTGTGLDAATTTVTIANGSIGNRSYTATWTPITYTLTYDLAGGAVATANPASYTIESNAITLTNPTREGYTFAGWTGTGLSGATQTVTIAKGSMGNRSYTATWTINQYSMTFVFGNGQENQVITQDYGTALTAPTPNEWTGHTFKGWNPEVPATIPAEDKTFTAQWDVNKYKLTFMVDDQVYSQTDVEYDAAIVVPENPTKEGYTFTSWDAAIPEKMPANDLTFNAQFTINQYSMTFVFGNGQENQVITQDYGTTLTAPTPNEWTGHTFKGWNPEVPATIPAEDKTFTAQWDVNKYKLTFMVDDQVYSQTDVEYDAAIVVPENPTKEGYTFTSWDAAIPEKMPANDLTFNAQFTINQYSMTFVFGNGQENQVITQDYGTALTAPTPNEWTGHTFKGWNPEVPATIPAEDKTFTAQWDVNKYKLTFMVDDQVYSQTDVEYDAAIVVPENPTKEGYTFTSWDAAIPEKMPAEDLTFNAQFTINQYYVIYIVKEQEWARDQFNYGETIVLRDAPTLEPGEIFVRWDSDEDYVTMPAHDITYTAVIDLPNGIVQVFQDKETAAVYTITGVLIDKNMSVSEVMKLAKGLYIVNGHKIYIK